MPLIIEERVPPGVATARHGVGAPRGHRAWGRPARVQGAPRSAGRWARGLVFALSVFPTSSKLASVGVSSSTFLTYYSFANRHSVTAQHH
jgi:hypothetical protein